MFKAQGEIEELYEDEPFERRYSRLYAQCALIGEGMDINRMGAPVVFDVLRNDHLLDGVARLIGPEITCSPIEHLRDKTPSRLAPEQDFSLRHAMASGFWCHQGGGG